MELLGIVVSGMGKGAYFMSQQFYIDQFREKLHFKPFIGTLNIKIDSNGVKNINDIPDSKFQRIIGKNRFGDVKLIKALLNNSVEGAIIFPTKTKHSFDVLEFIAKENIREVLKLNDGDSVTITID
jgi:riboflavin kinase, archaea type